MCVFHVMKNIKKWKSKLQQHYEDVQVPCRRVPLPMCTQQCPPPPLRVVHSSMPVPHPPVYTQACIWYMEISLGYHQFQRRAKKVLRRWESNGLQDFATYFDKQWVQNNNKWYQGMVLTIPLPFTFYAGTVPGWLGRTNNPLELMNSHFKKTYTEHILLSLLAYADKLQRCACVCCGVCHNSAPHFTIPVTIHTSISQP